MTNSHLIKILSVSLSLTIISCKKTEESEVQSATKLGGQTLDLSNYKSAGKAESDQMTAEYLKKKGQFYLKNMGTVMETYKARSTHHTRDELIALELYTSAEGFAVNTALRKASVEELNLRSGTIKMIATALNKVPAKACRAYRSMKSNPELDAIVANATKVNKWVESGFMSTTPDKSFAEYFLTKYGKSVGGSGYLMQITSSQCHEISFIFGTRMAEYGKVKPSEILFAPGSEFRIDKYTKQANGKPGILYVTHLIKEESGFKPIYSGSKQNIRRASISVINNYPVHATPTRSNTALLDTGLNTPESTDVELGNEADVD
ncbi:MAG: hypothetical protein H7249_07505 [Chitinophagaceae bacterium]|nr:hypothetical protein [Oligoflexus sp.]